MSRLPIVILLAVVVGVAASAAPVGAWGRGGHFGGHGFDGRCCFGPRVFFGVGPFWGWPGWGWPYAYPYYPPYAYAPYGYTPGYTPQVVAQPAPQAYAQQPAPAEPAQQSWWYYCASSRAYYPYVRQCPEAWMQVVPQQPSR